MRSWNWSPSLSDSIPIGLSATIDSIPEKMARAADSQTAYSSSIAKTAYDITLGSGHFTPVEEFNR